ncbi:hypothetical protein C8Q77DRAFT_1052620 [Trametes polyzona]|nr:hypothetical protein C8Q77DRAFT_1052620 [Trametes polyzona]
MPSNTLGQRIIESYAGFEEDDPSLSRPEPFTSLTIRRVKSAGLRIVTECGTLSPDVLQGTMSGLQPSNARHSYLSIRTPDTSHTFGLPNPSMRSPASHCQTPISTPSTTSTELLSSRRLSRYSRAESSLQSAAEASSCEVSPQELQIRALESATAALSEQAQDARACAERLRTCLANRELSPEETHALQRARWLEEHKCNSRQAQSARTRQLVLKLSSPIKEEAPLFESPRAMTRQEANLAHFLQRSPTRIAFPTSHYSPTSPVLHHRKTLSQIRPLRLRASAMELALRSPLRTHGRSRSLEGRHSRSNSASTDATYVSQDSSGQTAVARTSTLRSKPSPAFSPLTLVDEDGGTISIEKLAALRSRDELLAEVGNVTLPDYAVDLLEDLVSTTLDISLQEIEPVEGAAATSAGSTSDIPLVYLTPEPATLPHPLGRLRSQSEGPVSPSVSRTAPSSTARSRPTPRSGTSFRHSLAVPKFSSLRLSSPSLVPVPEIQGGSTHDRPHSSLSGRCVLDSSSAILEAAEDAHEGSFEDTRRFSVVSFRRLERGQSGSAHSGILARVKRRLSTLRQ